MRYPLLSTMIARGIKDIVDDPYSDMTRRIIRSMHDANPDATERMEMSLDSCQYPVEALPCEMPCSFHDNLTLKHSFVPLVSRS